MHALKLSLFAVLTLALSASVEDTGVASFGSSGNKTEAERQLEAEARSLNKITSDIIVKNTVQGALAGAAAGCGIALIFGGGGDDCAKGAAIGAVAGGVGGNAVGRQAAQKKTELIQRDKVLDNLRGVSKRLNGVEARLNGVLRSQDAELRSLRRQLAANQVSESSYNSRVRAINSNRKTVSNELLKSENNVKKTRAEIASARKQGQTNLSTVDRAAASNQSRLARTRSRIKLIQ